MTDKIKFYSMNAQGLSDKNKRKDVFNFLKSKKGTIYFLQDTHFTDTEINCIYIEFGFRCYFSNFRSSSRGVAFFISNDVDFKLFSKYNDEEGNMLILDCSINDKRLTLINIYGPNQDTPEFYKTLKQKINESENPCIIGGDYNLVLNPEIDCFEYLHVNNPKSRDMLIHTIIECDLIDCWRDMNLEKKEFT